MDWRILWYRKNRFSRDIFQPYEWDRLLPLPACYVFMHNFLKISFLLLFFNMEPKIQIKNFYLFLRFCANSSLLTTKISTSQIPTPCDTPACRYQQWNRVRRILLEMMLKNLYWETITTKQSLKWLPTRSGFFWINTGYYAALKSQVGKTFWGDSWMELAQKIYNMTLNVLL